MSQPVLTVLAGSNGAGKSTLTSYAREEFQFAAVLDPDAISKSIREVSSRAVSDLESGKRVLALAEQLLLAKQSFTVETTLSGSTYVRMVERAKREGYSITVLFIGTDSVEINIERVKARVRKGGHDIREADQRRRFPRTLANIMKLLPLADEVVLLDNSSEEGPRVVAVGREGSILWKDLLPAWAQCLRKEA